MNGRPHPLRRPRTWALAAVTFATASVSVPEFITLQRMPDDALRARFNLPPDCDPQLTAAADPPGRIRVVIVCKPSPFGSEGDRRP